MRVRALAEWRREGPAAVGSGKGARCSAVRVSAASLQAAACLSVAELQLNRPKTNLANRDDGFKGRVAIFEISPVTPQIQELIIKATPAQELEKVALSQGMLLMKQDGYLKVLQGITTMDEVLRVADT